MGEAARRIAAVAPDDKWLRLREAAAHANMSVSAFKSHVERGHIRPDSPARPGFKEHRFLRSSVDRWLLGES